MIHLITFFNFIFIIMSSNIFEVFWHKNVIVYNSNLNDEKYK